MLGDAREIKRDMLLYVCIKIHIAPEYTHIHIRIYIYTYTYRDRDVGIDADTLAYAQGTHLLMDLVAQLLQDLCGRCCADYLDTE